MKPLTINPFLKFLFMLSQIMLVMLTSNNIVILWIICCCTLYLFWKRVKFKLVLNGIKFGLFLGLFMLVFSQIRYGDWELALSNSLNLFSLYFTLIMISVAYKLDTTNKEIAYVLSVVFAPLTIVGYPQNKLYTLFLVILNQITSMREVAMRMYRFARFEKNSRLSIGEIINLIPAFINLSLKQNENLAIGLLNSGYNINNKKITPVFLKNYRYAHVVVLVGIIIVEGLIIR